LKVSFMVDELSMVDVVWRCIGDDVRFSRGCNGECGG
jgi:hypothetical protein